MSMTDRFLLEIFSGIAKSCVGSLISGTSLITAVPFIGLRFEEIENIVEQIEIECGVLIDSSLSKYFPTFVFDLYQLHNIDNDIPIFKRRSVLSNTSFASVARELSKFVEEYGNPFLSNQSSYEGACNYAKYYNLGGLGRASRRIPILYILAGQRDAANRYMSDILNCEYPIGNYESFTEVVRSKFFET